MRKYEVDRIHNSKDDEIYQIAQSVEQKIRTGMLMPDYEISQKQFHNFGEKFLNYLTPNDAFGEKLVANDKGWFETTYTIVKGVADYPEEMRDGYTCDIYANAQSLTEPTGKVSSKNRLVRIKVALDNNTKVYWKDENNEWILVVDGINFEQIGYTNLNHNIFVNPFSRVTAEAGGCTINIMCSNERKVRICCTKEFYNMNGSIHAYTDFGNCVSEIQDKRGVFVSKNKKWVYITDDKIDNICVLHGFNKYANNYETFWGASKSLNLWYKGYGRSRFGTSTIKLNSGELSYKALKRRMKWRKCNFISVAFRRLSNGYFETVFRLDKPYEYALIGFFKRINKKKTFHRKIGSERGYYLKLLFQANGTYEEWKMKAKPSGNNSPKFTFSFIREVPFDEAYKIINSNKRLNKRKYGTYSFKKY